jgi:hypothetical protein
LEGKDVKDLLLNVGSGGGAAAPAAGGAAGGADAGGAEAAKEEEKEEGMDIAPIDKTSIANISQRRKSQTTTWDSVFSIKQLHLLCHDRRVGCTLWRSFKTIN